MPARITAARFYSVEDFAAVVAESGFTTTKGTILRWLREGKLPKAKRPFGKWMIPGEYLLEFVIQPAAPRLHRPRDVKARARAIRDEALKAV